MTLCSSRPPPVCRLLGEVWKGRLVEALENTPAEWSCTRGTLGLAQEERETYKATGQFLRHRLGLA
jgi:hypothetical protein